MFIYLYAKQRQGEKPQLERCTVHKGRSNWTEGCWLRLLRKQEKKRDLIVHAHARFRHLDKDKRPCESLLAEVEGKADVPRSLFIRPEWGLCSSSLVFRLLRVEEVEDLSEEV